MTRRSSLDLAVIGNSNIAALIDRDARIVWGCWPRIDGDPIFCSLIDGDDAEDGFFAIELEGETTSEQSYCRNTAIVRTVLTAKDGASFSVTDFVPRFELHNRLFHPPMIVRRIEPLGGLCRIRVRVRPRMDHGRLKAKAVCGSNHIRYVSEAGAVRLTTDAPVSYVAAENGFILTRPLTLILHPDESLPDSIPNIGREFLDKTRDHWLGWARHLNLPFEWQEAVIRAAITLQLCSFEQTGGIVAALTTSIPEAQGTERNWDYRFCWLRDSYFTVQALNRVGASVTMERFIEYVMNVISLGDGPNLRPVYSLLPEHPLDELMIAELRGYRSHGPVRIGNAAAHQVQHDSYGSVILAAAQMFFDERLPKKGDQALFEMLEPLGARALKLALEPDAGIWEYRNRLRVHTHSAAMCWAACDRLARIAVRLDLPERARHWREMADDLRRTILRRAWNETHGYFAGVLDSDEIDASVLLLHELGIVAANDQRFVSTVEWIGRHLMRNGHLLRYASPDDFGAPESAFTICSFWYIDALAAIGKVDEARKLFGDMLNHRNHVGLLSEDVDPRTGELWGNFPQTYSMVGIIIAAMRLSKSWENAR